MRIRREASHRLCSPQPVRRRPFPLTLCGPLQDKDPVNLTHFYKSSAPNRSFSMSRKRVSFLVPTQFQERIVRVFSRNSDKAVCRAISVRRAGRCRREARVRSGAR